MNTSLTTSTRACGNSECRVAETGVCMEGHVPIEACPHLGDPDVDHNLDDEEHKSSDSPLSLLADFTAVHSGEALTERDVRDFIRWRAARRVAIIGDLSSGKTTLMCALYDRYLRGPFAGMSFVGSRSLVALERRSHYAREASGRVTPDTKRTSHTDGLLYYHFAVAPTGVPTKRVDLLLSDRAGEVYQRVRDDASAAQDLAELKEADRIVLLLDGARVAQIESWTNSIHGVRFLLRALLDGGAIGSTSVVQIVTTKIDLVRAAPDQEEVQKRLERFKANLTENFSQRLRSLTFWEVAARPTDMAQPPVGLDSLLVDWVTPAPLESMSETTSLNIRSEFDRLLLRTTMS